MKFHVTLPSAENLEITLQPGQFLGSSLINAVNANLNIPVETINFFGISYGDKYDGGKNWIKETDDLRKINAMNYLGIVHVQFTVRILPKDPHLNFSSAELRRLIRHHLKSLMVNDLLRCDVETSAKLDAYIVQAELGNHRNFGRETYSQHLDRLQIYLPMYVISESPVTQHEYDKKVQVNHRKFKDMTPSKADILFLNTVQNLQSYGHVWYKISDSLRKKHFIFLSADGICFVYEASIEKAVGSERRDIFSWKDVISCDVNNKMVRMKVCTKSPGATEERKFKMKSRYSYKDANRLKDDVEKYKEVYCDENSEMFKTAGAPLRARTEKIKVKGGRLASFSRSFRRLGSSKKRGGMKSSTMPSGTDNANIIIVQHSSEV